MVKLTKTEEPEAPSAPFTARARRGNAPDVTFEERISRILNTEPADNPTREPKGAASTRE